MRTSLLVIAVLLLLFLPRRQSPPQDNSVAMHSPETSWTLGPPVSWCRQLVSKAADWWLPLQCVEQARGSLEAELAVGGSLPQAGWVAVATARSGFCGQDREMMGEL